jgi:hypothetical protein
VTGVRFSVALLVLSAPFSFVLNSRFSPLRASSARVRQAGGKTDWLANRRANRKPPAWYLRKTYKRHPRGIFTMAESHALSKAEEAYLYIIQHQQQNPNFGKTLFFKMLYFADFDSYELFEKAITGSKYRKIENGPAPCDFDKIITSLKNRGYVKELSLARGGKKQIRYLLLKDPTYNNLSQDEFNQLKRNISRLQGMTATQVSAYSHEDMPYKATKMKEVINYDLVYYRNPQFAVSKT